LPIGVIVVIVKSYAMSIILRYLKPLLEFWDRSKLSDCGLIGCIKQVLLLLAIGVKHFQP